MNKVKRNNWILFICLIIWLSFSVQLLTLGSFGDTFTFMFTRTLYFLYNCLFAAALLIIFSAIFGRWKYLPSILVSCIYIATASRLESSSIFTVWPNPQRPNTGQRSAADAGADQRRFYLEKCPARDNGLSSIFAVSPLHQTAPSQCQTAPAGSRRCYRWAGSVDSNSDLGKTMSAMNITR